MVRFRGAEVVLTVLTREPFGAYLGIYRAGTQLEAFLNSGQGHVITSLLLFCLQNDLVKQALVTHMSAEHPWKAKAVLSRDEQAVKRARGSKAVEAGYIWAKEIEVADLLRHRTSPMVIKEYGGGYKRGLLTWCSNQSVSKVPLTLSNLVGALCIIYYKYVASPVILLRYGFERLWIRLRP